MTENPSPDTLADASHMSAADGGGTVESSTVSLADLSKALGTDLKDASTALKAIADTKAYVGKRKEDIASELKASITPAVPQDVASKSDIQALKNDLFLSENPRFKEYAPLLQKISPNLAEAAESAEFKAVFEKAKVADEVAKTKSVVASNSRLAQSKTAINEMVETANARGTTMEDVALVAARAINTGNRE